MKSKLMPALLVLAPLVVQALAQTITTGELAGTVTDPSGAVVADASVELKSLDEGSVTNTKTSSTGYYQFAYLKPGNYAVTVIGPGFQSSQKKVTVALGGSASLNFQLTLGASTTTVEVSGTTAALETEDANVTANFDARQVELLKCRQRLISGRIHVSRRGGEHGRRRRCLAVVTSK